jgi:acyl-CoA synthetase (AMP-forming)/AMP-acid ligase II
MPRTLPQVTRENAKQYPDSIATVFGDRTSTWRELDDASSRIANGLFHFGAVAGTRVAVLDKNSDRFFEIFFGAAKAGAVLVPLNWRLAPPEIRFMLADSETRILFVANEFAESVAQIRGELPALKEIVVLDYDAPEDAYAQWKQGFDAVDPVSDRHPADDAVQLYTSGTTGRPKGALISHAYFFENFRMLQDVPSRYWESDPSDATLVTAPLFHIGGINWAFMGAVQGCALVVMREFDPTRVLESLSRYQVRSLALVTPMLQMVLNTPGVESADFSQVRYVVYGASPIPPALLRKAIDVIGCEFVQTYGMTESTMITLLDVDDHQLPPVPQMLSVGRPLPGVELAVLDRDGAPLATGEIGEFAIKSPVLPNGYWRLPEATAEAFRDGWFHTGDAGYIDENGYVYLKDRVKDMIISGGENIYPAEVENALYEHASVKEVAVVGVPDDRWGEVPKAFIVLQPGAELDEESLRSFTAERIARYKLPRHFAAVEGLPKTATGKVMRRELRSQ